MMESNPYTQVPRVEWPAGVELPTLAEVADAADCIIFGEVRSASRRKSDSRCHGTLWRVAVSIYIAEVLPPSVTYEVAADELGLRQSTLPDAYQVTRRVAPNPHYLTALAMLGPLVRHKRKGTQ